MRRPWRTTIIYVAAAWILFLCSEALTDGFLKMLAFAGYFIALFAGAIALVIRLAQSLLRRRNLLAPLAMALAVLPLFFMLEIRESVARTQDFILRDVRTEVVAQLQSGELLPDEYGFVELPAGRKLLSEDGTVRVIMEGNKLCAVVFYNMRAILGPAFSTVYSISGTAPDAQMLGSYELYSCEPLGGGWYYVWYE